MKSKKLIKTWYVNLILISLPTILWSLISSNQVVAQPTSFYRPISSNYEGDGVYLIAWQDPNHVKEYSCWIQSNQIIQWRANLLTICPCEVIVHQKTSSLWRFRSKYKQKLNGWVVYITYKLGMKRNLGDLGIKSDLIRYDNLKTFWL